MVGTLAVSQESGPKVTFQRQKRAGGDFDAAPEGLERDDDILVGETVLELTLQQENTLNEMDEIGSDDEYSAEEEEEEDKNPRGIVVVNTWLSQNKLFYFYFELGQRSKLQFSRTPTFIEQWRRGQMVWVGAVRFFQDKDASSPGGFGRAASRETAKLEMFESGDVILVPAVTPDKSLFIGKPFGETCDAFEEDAVEKAPRPSQDIGDMYSYSVGSAEQPHATYFEVLMYESAARLKSAGAAHDHHKHSHQKTSE
mmetsp:Transcript_98723/g.175736  ORF Transcript_98723/g.175736 Transcript_98723/m.175736 type:complete len:255 (+) Transcript_98723:37-801(+)